MSDTRENQRTIKQNRSLWKFSQDLADTLNDAGLSMQMVLKPGIQISWTKDSIHDYIVIPISKAMYHKDSTTTLTTKELSSIAEEIIRHFGEKGIVLDWPSIETLINNQRREP
jgi:hypothetical protein